MQLCSKVSELTKLCARYEGHSPIARGVCPKPGTVSVVKKNRHRIEKYFSFSLDIVPKCHTLCLRYTLHL